MDENEIIVDLGYQGYTFVGAAQGRFEADGPNGTKEKRPYYNMYVLTPVSDYRSDDYQAFGLKADKLKCVSPSVWENLEIGERVRLMFDDKKRVQMAISDDTEPAE